MVLNIYKPLGWTPLQALDALRKVRPELQDAKMTYAGRLDPMAEGVLVVLVGEAVHTKEEYTKLDKTYEADIMFGIGTDTHDLLGMPTIRAAQKITNEQLEEAIKNMHGEKEYAFPIYSSKPVEGKPLFQWARENRMHEIKTPTRLMCVQSMRVIERRSVTGLALQDVIKKNIGNVAGDFRQEAIVAQWNALLGEKEKEIFDVVRVTVQCGSGTYIRTLAHTIGRQLGADAILARLVRTSVGPYAIGDSLRFDNKKQVEDANDSK
ncbi:MAG: tRNA pseudouridine synthase B [Candidatus Wolfebacteria bacterium GW2011_GWC2_39_22]|uniref:tRNA pseudouridine(55) synthase n=1 Tax=Candidatus Wolfebacteria bacterium GW2011_GWC2_39_22 TaxID=1619013 RepID=A0A0G0N9V3_9BACT|nr:MAG: tRNA pseudouridine synthase B [Candidatus Wolfebacteria bacterium GW2011_GWC2_39_22]HBI25378.1 hypothetical protein [Candidatus Wolfebacteria bacterium]